eukprot:CAMPEP_0184685422 /NCGR_PEP_ID=MMETSP0312-20130426/18915_1 /TAXON_ID=31354 /ORGANISM="Compsopogon coeruleus, Strain SAG 36.94" /LENGTH=61 /DNA_ID=CAMNT_0027139511 /DNA_START=26 /DNA_END=211 /DNA_ORIENTATION=-
MAMVAPLGVERPGAEEGVLQRLCCSWSLRGTLLQEQVKQVFGMCRYGLPVSFWVRMLSLDD